MVILMFKKKNVSFIVYQMGKVGSSGIKTSLEKRYGKNNVIHTHSHSDAKEQIELRSRHADSVVVITGFREPLTRCISAYFENLTNNLNHWYVGTKEEVMNKSIEWLINDYNQKVLPHIDKIVNPWLINYENTISYKLADFSQDRSHWKAALGNIHFYIYKLETINDFSRHVTDDIFFKNVRFSVGNVGAEKWSGEIYRNFKNSFRIDRNDYDAVYGGIDYLQRLYGNHEARRIARNLIVE